MAAQTTILAAPGEIQIHLRAWTDDAGRPIAFNIRLVDDGVILWTIGGYDTSLPRSLGLYRLIAIDDIVAAEEQGLVLNQGGGNSDFKRRRGGEPAIEFEVISPNDARGMFDVLTYQKGGSVLRMLEQYLGEETFRDGIRKYLKKHSYANTVTTDLWDALEEVFRPKSTRASTRKADCGSWTCSPAACSRSARTASARRVAIPAASPTAD